MKISYKIRSFSFLLAGALLIMLNSCQDETTTNNDNQLKIGSSYQGGYIAYFLQQGDRGYDPAVPHGLIAAPYDQGNVQWGCQDLDIPNTSTLLGTGQANTTIILAGCSEANIAAKLCDSLVVNGYSDWYLPSKDELNKLYLGKSAIGGFEAVNYWSSSASSPSVAWYQNFGTGAQSYDWGYGGMKRETHNVRAVRSF